jgi:class 3 adenylate cyclase
VIGNGVNLASRLLDKAGAGEIFVDPEIATERQESFELTSQ